MPFKEFAKKVAQGFKVNPPQKEASKMNLQIAWRLDWLNHKIRGKRRKLSKQMALNLPKKNYYSNNKITEDLNINFKSIDASIIETSQHFLKDVAS